MSEADEIRALMEELEQLTQEAANSPTPDALRANDARQHAIRERLAALGRPIG